ncbi:bifunctional serine/threonine-protein kinase/formylglycine-generating enzyme family protein [Microbulbifer agarilyticus]|uniref:bifunctional serine/threonine-protein kinase/formylglycine-generating enzyme family protein n=1 Tax=Microbulbifer agarilyticus TaxID=260552 RepID=UPI0018DCE77B|nr:bifunctional serine/threonine-protein kinase/formylglycine-generating enzyme family protein [Microbulbifer agarilyticus]
MNDKTRIVKKAAENLSACGDSDVTVFVGNDNTGANDHPQVNHNPGLERAIPGQSSSVQTSSSSLVESAGSKSFDATRVVDGLATSDGLPRPHEAVHFEPSSSREGAVTKTVIKGRFELDKLLGVGGMGAVYKALDRRKLEASDSDPYVAIKLLNEDFQQHPDAFISLQREARKSQTLAHPNIVTVYDFDREGDRVFMTMEFLEGAPLDQLLRKSAGVGVGKEKAALLLKDVSNALIYAHSHRIVHSDFKPGNIFVTEKKGAKVIDFGIARAVSEGGVASKAGEKTVFDAGTLGALTPAYASLEMLKGGEPQPSDDVFALGCVAYELFSGRHPYDKVPADKAFEKKLKPKRIKTLSRRQWRALDSALALRRQERTDSVERFVQGFFGKTGWKWAFGSLFAATLIAGGMGYTHLEKENAEEQRRVKVELEEKLQNELVQRRIADKKETIGRLLELSVLNQAWERDLRIELQEYSALNPSDAAFAESTKRSVSDLFIAAATGQLNLGNLEPAERMLSRAVQWNEGVPGAEEIRSQLETEREALRVRLEQERIAAEREAERMRREVARAAQLRVAQEKQKKINLVIDDLESMLKCDFNISVDRIGYALSALQQVDATKAKLLRPVIGEELAGCFDKLALRNPTNTQPLLDSARNLLPQDALLADLDIDYCAHLAPGSGGRGDRYSCADSLVSGGLGPEMVVVNGGAGRPLAVGKYEVSAGEISQFCRVTGDCSSTEEENVPLPARNLSLAQAQAYIHWLNGETGREYRLPSEREWFAAASANGQPEVADRNCYLRYGGVEKGVELVAVRSGSANPFGIVNAVGNVQEWVFDVDNNLLAAGGSRQDPMSRCLATSKIFHDGSADGLTGFRLVRDLVR